MSVLLIYKLLNGIPRNLHQGWHLLNDCRVIGHLCSEGGIKGSPCDGLQNKIEVPPQAGDEREVNDISGALTLGVNLAPAGR